MMLSDAPHYETTKANTDKDGHRIKHKSQRRKKGKDAVSFFQSMLKNNELRDETGRD